MKTLLLDMYGVVIKESKGNFTPYVYSHYPETDREFYRELFEKAATGIIDSTMFFAALGFTDPENAMRDYIENHLTLDERFLPFATAYKDKYNFVLLSNDVLEWSEHIRLYFNIDSYFNNAIISANTGYRKPDERIFAAVLDRVGIKAVDCIFVDNNTTNLEAASKLGMDTILFNRDNEAYNGKTVYSFDELSCIL